MARSSPSMEYRISGMLSVCFAESSTGVPYRKMLP